MTTSIHIFDEFQELVETLDDAQRHKKRMDLEKLIYSSLKYKYGEFFKTFWKSWSGHRDSSKKIIIIERRIHENLEFLIHNAAWAGAKGGWNLCVVCSDVNEKYIRAIIGDKDVQIISLFKGNPSPQEGKQEYNELLQSSEFFEYFDEDYICLMEMDCYFRKQIPDSVMTCDYIAAPYAWDGSFAGGGLSFRNRKTMVDICSRFPEKMPAADIFACKGVRELGYSMPPLLYSKDIVAESILDGDPIGVHQWWTFFSPKLNDAETIFERFMTLEIS